MKAVATLLLLFLFSHSLHAQNFSRTVRADVSGLLYFTRLQQDTLVPPKKRGRGGIIGELMVNGYYDFTRGNPDLQFRIGLGYSQKDLLMSKTPLLQLFPGRNRDTFSFSRIRFQYDFLNLPLGVTYRLTKRPDSWFQVQAGLQANVGFCLHKKVQLVIDPTVAQPSTAEMDRLKENYNAGASSVVAGLHPRIDLNARIYKNVGIFYSLQFSTLQLNSFHKNIAVGGTGLGGGLGAYVNL